MRDLSQTVAERRTYLEREARSGRVEGCPDLSRRLPDELDRLLEGAGSATAAGEGRL